MNYQEAIDCLINNGVTFITQHYDDIKNIWYCDLKFDAKSYGHLYEKNKRLIIELRYGGVWEVDDFNDILYAFKEAYGMRGWGNPDWIELCKKNNKW